MRFHFAAARTVANSPLARAMAPRRNVKAANDNAKAPCRDASPGVVGWGEQDRMLKAALRQFSEHGLSAAREAAKQAEQAFFSGDRQSYDWWMAVCRTLDKRLADQVGRNMG